MEKLRRTQSDLNLATRQIVESLARLYPDLDVEILRQMARDLVPRLGGFGGGVDSEVETSH